MNLYLLLATYGTVFVTEIVGDKTLFTIGSLTTCVRLRPLFCGMSAAFACKMLVAVCLGGIIAQISGSCLGIFSAFSFFAAALLIWLKTTQLSVREIPIATIKAPLVVFSAILLSEWADAGQITTAALAARYHAPFTVWAGATLALITKGAFGATVGLGLRTFLPHAALRYGALTICLAMGIFATVRIGA